MKFKLSKKELTNVLKLSSTIINENSINPILTCILVKTSSSRNVVDFLFSNEKEFIRLSIDNVLIDDDFAFCVKSKIFNGILSKLNSDEINFEKNDTTLRISTTSFESNINLIDDMLYPELNFDEYKIADKIITFNREIIDNIYKKTASTVAQTSEQNTKLILCGIHFKSVDSQLSIVSTDSYRASYLTIPNPQNNNFEFVVEPFVLKNIIDNTNNTDVIEIYYKDNVLFFKWANIIMQSKIVLDGAYPNIYNHFIKEQESKFSIKNKDLLNMLEHGSSLVQSEKTPTARLIVNQEKVEIRYQSIDFGSSFESVKWETFNGVEINLYVNIRLLISILKIYNPEDELLISYSNGSPIIIKEINSSDLRHLVLPLRS